MKASLLTFLGLILCSPAVAGEENMYKKDVALWYEAFDKHDPAILDKILHEDWQESPSEPGTRPAGREDVKRMLVKLTSTFPDFTIKIDDIIQEGNKVVVRSTITGTQATEFRGFPSKNRKMTMQAIDIHEFKDGKIVHTWHSEDWMTGLHQLGVFDK
ncbi:MAG: ester cyclase [Candidatus Entotheonellia bacterium]